MCIWPALETQVTYAAEWLVRGSILEVWPCGGGTKRLSKLGSTRRDAMLSTCASNVMTKVVWIKWSIEDGSEAPVIGSAQDQRHVKGRRSVKKKKRNKRWDRRWHMQANPELKEATLCWQRPGTRSQKQWTLSDFSSLTNILIFQGYLGMDSIVSTNPGLWDQDLFSASSLFPPLFGRFEVRGSAGRKGGRDRSRVDQGQKNIETTQSQRSMMSYGSPSYQGYKRWRVGEHCKPKKKKVKSNFGSLS